jgi:hypothetical protein
MKSQEKGIGLKDVFYVNINENAGAHQHIMKNYSD